MPRWGETRKLQMIRRSNGTYVFVVTIPLEEVLKLGWKKGDNIMMDTSKSDRIVLIKESDDSKEKEEDSHGE